MSMQAGRTVRVRETEARVYGVGKYGSRFRPRDESQEKKRFRAPLVASKHSFVLIYSVILRANKLAFPSRDTQNTLPKPRGKVPPFPHARVSNPLPTQTALGITKSVDQKRHPVTRAGSSSCSYYQQ